MGVSSHGRWHEICRQTLCLFLALPPASHIAFSHAHSRLAIATITAISIATAMDESQIRVIKEYSIRHTLAAVHALFASACRHRGISDSPGDALDQLADSGELGPIVVALARRLTRNARP